MTHEARQGIDRRAAVSLVLATMVNPLNSTMLAVGLVSIAAALDVSLGIATSLVIAFYAVGAVAQPVLGQLVDRLGPRRVLCGGMAVALAASPVGALSEAIGPLIVARALLALGTSAAYPATMAMLRQHRLDDAAPTATIAGVSAGSGLSTMLGPPLAGVLILVGGWPALFWFNVPLIAVTLAMVLAWLPRDLVSKDTVPHPSFDVTGALLCTATVLALSLALTVRTNAAVVAAAAFVPLAALFVIVERRQPNPFIDLRLGSAAPALRNIYIVFFGFNLIWYAFAIGLPSWLQDSYGLDPTQTGVLMLAPALLSVGGAPFAAKAIGHWGAMRITGAGLLGLLATCISLLSFGAETSLTQLIASGALAGASGSLMNIGLQVRLYQAAPGQLGTAAGLYSGSRHASALLSAGLIGFTLADVSPGSTFLATAAVMTAICALLLAIDLRRPRPTGVVGQRR